MAWNDTPGTSENKTGLLNELISGEQADALIKGWKDNAGLGQQQFGSADLTKDLSEQNHLPGQNYFDSSIKGGGGLIDRQAGRGLGYYKGALEHGIDGPTGLADAASSDPMAQALAGRYESKYDTAKQGIKAGTATRALIEKSAGDATAASEMQQVYSNEQQNYAEQYAFQVQRENLYKQWENQKQAAQAAIAGAVFGGIGAAMGTVMGGPVGGAAGGAAGKGIASAGS